MLTKVNNVYFSGINGIGMSGLAKILAADGFNVAGSDLERKAVTKDMEDMGIKVYIGQVEENVKDEQLRGEFINRDRFAKLHNMYIDFFVQNGILGLLYLVFLFVLIPFEFFKSEKNKESISAFFSMIFYCFYGLTWSLWSSLGISQVLFHTFLIWMLVNLKRKNL